MLAGERLKIEYDRLRKAAPRSVALNGSPVAVAGGPVAVLGCPVPVTYSPSVAVADCPFTIARVHCKCINANTGQLCLAKLQRASAFTKTHPNQLYYACSKTRILSDGKANVISPIYTLFILLTQFYLSYSRSIVNSGDYWPMQRCRQRKIKRGGMKKLSRVVTTKKLHSQSKVSPQIIWSVRIVKRRDITLEGVQIKNSRHCIVTWGYGVAWQPRGYN